MHADLPKMQARPLLWGLSTRLLSRITDQLVIFSGIIVAGQCGLAVQLNRIIDLPDAMSNPASIS
jgi:hypothetical protein